LVQAGNRRTSSRKQLGNIACYQLDYILLKLYYSNSVKSACAYADADEDTYHNPFIMKSKVQLKFEQKKKSRSRRDKETLQKVQKELKNKTRSHQKQTKELNSAISTAATIVVGYKKKQVAKKPRTREEMLAKN